MSSPCKWVPAPRPDECADTIHSRFELPRVNPANDNTDYLLDFAREAPEHVRVDVRRYKELPEAFQQEYWAGSKAPACADSRLE